jgi:hypothetical protein
MASSLAWLDFSEQEQRQVLGVVELFRERNTVDELGVGVVRDTFSDLLFPGTSTLHTRGRYVLFIPWIYQAIERSPTQCQDPWKHARWAEIRLIDSLVDSEDGEAAIGTVARATLKMFASTAYWAALTTWGLRLFAFSQDQYHRWLRAGGHRRLPTPSDEEDADGTGSSAWRGSLPPAPQGFPNGVSFRFESGESEYIAERIAMTVPGTLLALLLEERVDVAGIEHPWDLAAVLKLPANIQEQLAHASRFSALINGAPLLYNLMLAEKSSRADKDELREDFEERLSEWAREIEGRSSELGRCDRATFWDLVAEAGTRTPPPTRHFIERWLDLTIEGDPGRIANDRAARRLIGERERAVKRGRARLHNPQALALWGGDSGTARLVYRWPNARTIVRDVVAGLGDGGA